jgi:uncharacterized membrane protein
LNVGNGERLISVIGGLALSVWGVKRLKSTTGKLGAVTGVLLLKRGVTGYCEVNQLMKRNTAVKKASAMEVKGTFTINKPRAEVYAYWRNLENLPRFMKHLHAVEVKDERRSLWKVRIPGGLGTISWEAVLEEDGQNEFLSWSSLPGSTIDNAGEVIFKDAPGGRGTEVMAKISYRLPAGDLGSIAAKLFNPFVEQMLREDIRRFKSVMEAGEVPTIEGQTSARTKDKIKASALHEPITPNENKEKVEDKELKNYESPLLERH